MKKIIALPFILALLVLAACGGGGETESAAPQPTTLDWTFSSEFDFAPETAAVKAGSSVTVNLDNSGSGMSHSWILVPSDLSENATPEEIEAASISPMSNSGEVAAGDKTSFTFVAPAAGQYQYVCSIAGHLVGGMAGNLIVSE